MPSPMLADPHSQGVQKRRHRPLPTNSVANMSGYGGSAGSGYGGYGGDSYAQPSGYGGSSGGGYGAPPAGGYGGYDQYAAGSGGGGSSYAASASYGGSSYDSRSGSVKGAGVQLCADFQRGRCMRDNCRYVHDPNSASGAQVCNDFLRGRCLRESCRFLHQAPAMGAQPSSYPPPYQQQPSYQPPPTQSSYGYGGGSSSYASGTAVQKCADFARGRCMRDNCRFVHDAAAAAPRNPSPPLLICSALLMSPCSCCLHGRRLRRIRVIVSQPA